MFTPRQEDHFLEHRTSGDHDKSILKRMYFALCPCFVMAEAYAEERQTPKIQSVQSSRKGSVQDEKQQNLSHQMSEIRTPSSTEEKPDIRKSRQYMFRSAFQRGGNQKQLQQFFEMRRKSEASVSLPIHELQSETLQLVGAPQSRMLLKISTAKITPPSHLLEKTRKLVDTDNAKSMFHNPKLESFWSRRYLLFDKFDLGIKMDEDSWYTAPPEAVAQHLSTRIKCATVLDGFCGVGSFSLKFAHTCHTVLANDKDFIKVECLQANECVYGAQNITTLNYDFLELPQVKADVIFLALHGPKDDADPLEHYPLAQIIEKSMSIINNFVLFLPPNIDVHKLTSILAESINRADKRNGSCSIELEKIYYMNSLKYVAVFYGPLVNRQVKLSDELQHIYKVLQKGQEGVFEHKKLVKTIRQRYGMINLLKWAYECQKYSMATVMDSFHQFIEDEGLISGQELQLLQKYERKRAKRQDDEEEKIDSSRSERTQSFVTNEQSGSFSGNSPNMNKNLRMTVTLPVHGQSI